MTCIIDIFQFYSKSEHKYVKGFEIKGVVYKSDSFFSYLQRGTLFIRLLKFIFWKTLLQKWMIAVPREKSPLFNFIP